MTTNTDITVELGGFEIVCNVDITPYDPGVTSGPPERCYPPEGGEVEINSMLLRVKPGDSIDCFIDIEDLIFDLGGLEKVQELVDDEVAKMEPDNDGPEPDYDTPY